MRRATLAHRVRRSTASGTLAAAATMGHRAMRPPPAFEVFYDGSCPLCVKEISHCQHWDRDRNAVTFTNIAAPEFDAMAATGHDKQTLNRRIHGRVLIADDRSAAGRICSGIEVFKRMYFHLGWDAAYSPPAPHLAPRLIGAFFYAVPTPIGEAAYGAWAKFRIWNRNRKVDRAQRESSSTTSESEGSVPSSTKGKTCDSNSCRL